MRITIPRCTEAEDGRTQFWIFAPRDGKVQIVLADSEPLEGEDHPHRFVSAKAARRIAEELTEAADDAYELPASDGYISTGYPQILEPGTYRVKVYLAGVESRLVTVQTCRLLSYLFSSGCGHHRGQLRASHA
jgi:hypothetical protein